MTQRTPAAVTRANPTSGSRWWRAVLAHPLAAAVIAFAVCYRLFLPVRSGQLGPDESQWILQAQTILQGKSFPLLAGVGTHGQANSAYHLWVIAGMLAVTRSQFVWFFLVASGLMILASVLVAYAVPAGEQRMWTLLLAVTSPLLLWFTMLGVSGFPLAHLNGSVALYLHARWAPGRWWREGVLGLVLGIAAGTHPAGLVLLGGILLARLLVLRVVWGFLALAAGTFLGALPYLVGFVQVLPQLQASLVRGDEQGSAAQITDIPLNLLRYFGQHRIPRVNTDSLYTAFLAGENFMHQLTAAATWLIVVAGAVALWRLRRRLPASRLAVATLACALASTAFGWVTNTLWRDYTQGTVWWLTPVLIPACLLAVPQARLRRTLLAALVGVNVVAVVIAYAPRALNGTSIGWGHGPSWWMDEQVVSQVCSFVDKHPEAEMVPLEIACKFCDVIIPNVAQFRDPACGTRLAPVPVGKAQGEFLWVGPAEDRVHLTVRVDRRS